MFWLWTVLTVAAGLLSGLYGYHLGGHPTALAFTLSGAATVIGIKDLIRSKHAILCGTLVAASVGWYACGWAGAFFLGGLVFNIQLAINDFVIRRNARLPLFLMGTVLAWWVGFQYYSPLAALIYAVIAFLFMIAFDDYFLQRAHAIRRNFPLIGWFRYGFELIGDELRQYWFMGDNEEHPADRETRRYIYRSAKGLNNKGGFGTSRPYRNVGEIHLLHDFFPNLNLIRDNNRIPALVIGKKRRHPYHCAWPIGVSGMSYGSVSPEFIMALSSGAREANIHLNIGEGGYTEYHRLGVVKRIPMNVWFKFWSKKARWLLSGRRGAAPVAPMPEVVGGARIVIQIGPAKFGFRRLLTDPLKTPDQRGFRKIWSNELDWDYIAKLSASGQVVMWELKLHQGAKAGEGGLLPKAKISEEIAEARGISMEEDCHSPNAWEEFGKDLNAMLDFIARMQDVTGQPVGIKIAYGQEKKIRELVSLMKARGIGPDFITVDGGEGGTGAAPLALADTMGLPLFHAIPRLDNLLREFGIRDDVTIIASGRIFKGSDVAIAIALGADMVHIARGNMFAGGCIQAKRCHTNSCPVGIATQDPRFRRGFDAQDKYIRVANYNRVLQRELLMLINAIGVDHPWELTRAHVSVVSEPMVEKLLIELYPYSDGTEGVRNVTLGAIPPDNDETFDLYGPKLCRQKTG